MRNRTGLRRGSRRQHQQDSRHRGWASLPILLSLGLLSTCLAGCPRATSYQPQANLIDTLGVPEATQRLKGTLLRALAPRIVDVDVTEEFLRYRYRQEIAGIATGALPEQRLAFLNMAQVDIFPDNTVNVLADNGLLLAQLVFGSRQDVELFADLVTSFRARRAHARGR
jgi:hypothetical protein